MNKPKIEISKLCLTFVVQHLSNVVKRSDATMYTMQRVRVRRTDDASCWIVEATDGRRIVTNMVDAPEVVTELDRPLEFPLDSLDLLKLKLKQLPKHMLDSDMVDVTECEKKLDLQFPPVETLLNRDERYYSVCFNAEYLEQMLHAMRDHKRQTMVTLRFKDDRAPIQVTCGGSSFGVLMPCRGETSWGKPEESKEGVA